MLLTLNFIFRRKWKNASLVFVYTLIVFLLASVIFFAHAIKREASIILEGAPEIVLQKVVAGRHDLMPVSYISKISSIAGIDSVRGRLWGYYFDRNFGANYTLMAPEEYEHGDGNIVIGAGVSRVSVASEDNLFPLVTYDGNVIPMNVQKLLSSESELVSADLILMSEADFRRVSGVPQGYVTDLAVRVSNSTEIPTIARKITKLLPDTRPITRNEILRTYDAVFNWRAGIALLILSGAVVSFMIFAWDKATGLSAEEKKEIGVLKATGWETSDVILLKFWEGTVLSLSAFLAGVVLAYIHVFWGLSVFLAPVLKGWSVLYPEFRLVPFIDAYQIAALFFLTVIPYISATIIPAWRAANTDPDAVMRG
ncbi:MAG: FtsX-like permease family protein [Nitrospirae bacterium]|nr:FtsX-like permease family protein [Nitrospirota bacterium]